jgi:hypothetical protein
MICNFHFGSFSFRGCLQNLNFIFERFKFEFHSQYDFKLKSCKLQSFITFWDLQLSCWEFLHLRLFEKKSNFQVIVSISTGGRHKPLARTGPFVLAGDLCCPPVPCLHCWRVQSDAPLHHCADGCQHVNFLCVSTNRFWRSDVVLSISVHLWPKLKFVVSFLFFQLLYHYCTN